jgi:hypothetical protein
MCLDNISVREDERFSEYYCSQSGVAERSRQASRAAHACGRHQRAGGVEWSWPGALCSGADRIHGRHSASSDMQDLALSKRA